jgi:hypothetical protein
MNLTSLKGRPEYVDELDCSNNKLSSFDYFPKKITRLEMYNNDFTSIEGCPRNLSYLCATGNRIKSIDVSSINAQTLFCYYTTTIMFGKSILTVGDSRSENVYLSKNNTPRGTLLKQVSRLIDEGEGIYRYIQQDPTKFLPQELYDEIMNLPICHKCKKRGLLNYTINPVAGSSIKITINPCC